MSVQNTVVYQQISFQHDPLEQLNYEIPLIHTWTLVPQFWVGPTCKEVSEHVIPWFRNPEDGAQKEQYDFKTYYHSQTQ